MKNKKIKNKVEGKLVQVGKNSVDLHHPGNQKKKTRKNEKRQSSIIPIK